MSHNLLERVSTLPFGRLIDVGCGSGEFVVQLAALRPKAHYTGIDIDRNALAHARSRARTSHLAAQVEFACGDCLSIPLTGNTVDVIVFRCLLHHIKDISLVLREACRVLRTGEVLVIQDGTKMAAEAFSKMNKELARSGLPGEVHPGFDIAELTEALQRHNLVVERVIEAGRVVYATPPYTTKVYSTTRFLIKARRFRDGKR